MTKIETISRMQEVADEQRALGKKLALVPTMGALHEGHLSLVKRAMDLADHVTVSIFVNPTQFGPNEDFDRYPRPLERDVALLDDLQRVDVVFVPTMEAMYPRGQDAQRVWVQAEEIDRYLCGAYRPGHFRGVATVVAKLFNACRPHIAVFGLKDAQQFLILRRMSEDLNMGVDLVGAPTFREKDGLAASSRNVYLDEVQRREAPCIYEALQRTRRAVEAGERNAEALRRSAIDYIASQTSGELQYLDIVETETIQPIEMLEPGREVLVATAVFFGKTRLIDNVFLTVPAGRM